MTDEEFDRRLQAYIFEDPSAADRQALARAVLESEERGIRFGQAEELHHQLSQPEFRQELLRTLARPPAVADAGQPSWWQALFAPRYLAAMAASAAVVIGILAWRDSGSTSGVPNAPTVARVDSPKGAMPARPGTNTGTEAIPMEMTGGRPEGAALFAIPPARAMDLAVVLSGAKFHLGEQVSVKLTLPEAAAVYAVVKGPSGSVRQVFPTAERAMLDAGEHEFSFAATGRMDPEKGGVFHLRLFVSSEDYSALAAPERWKKLVESARYQEAEYEAGP